MRTVIRSLLERHTTFDVCGEAVDGVDAIEQAKALNPDLILLDLAMPNMSGAEAASVLKQTFPLIPIILFTMYSEFVGSSIVAATGIDVVLSKPDGMTQLIQCAQALLA